ncbi:MAG TPA: class I adenylate-forming enzyme family protein [Terriglobales bacterium]|nr:class I adenylate-forming enzyme family protein [Terriglobales bacterium]
MADLPQLTLDDYEVRFADRHLVHNIVRKWAKEKPGAPAIVNADRGTSLDWATFDAETNKLARAVQGLGLRKGDFVATSLPLTTEHIIFEFACFKAGVIVAPLDLRLAPAEVIRCINVIGAKAFVFLGKSPLADFRDLGRAVHNNCASVQHLIQFSPPEELIEGAQAFESLSNPAGQELTGEVSENDGALVIFTTGSTGSPKPALLSHRNITCQCMCISQAFFEGDNGTRMLVNLPASHVGCQTELMMGTLFGGGTAVILETFDAVRSLRAIPEHKVKKIGQIPALFNFEWRLRDYSSYDLSSLDFAAYGGQQVSPAFMKKMAAMAPRIATGLGLTESAGFCTYILEDSASASSDGAAILNSLGIAMPVYPFTIRQAMRDDGSASDELTTGEIGHVCFRGPQTFLGYINDPEATARTISTDGWLYTGDLGFRDERGHLHMTGRAKWVIKSFGYQIFPADVENHIALLEDKVASCAVVGAEHAIISEGIVAFVEKKPGAEPTLQELDRHARGLSAYMRPRHWVILEPGQMPLTRTVKPDYVRLSQMAREEIARLRAAGKWDKATTEFAIDKLRTS